MQVARSRAAVSRGSGGGDDKDGWLTAVNVAVISQYARACKQAQGVVMICGSEVLVGLEQENVAAGAGDEREQLLDLPFVMPGQYMVGVVHLTGDR